MHIDVPTVINMFFLQHIQMCVYSWSRQSTSMGLGGELDIVVSN